MFEWSRTNDVLGTANRGNSAVSIFCLTSQFMIDRKNLVSIMWLALAV
jgi:hypothetical protein